MKKQVRRAQQRSDAPRAHDRKTSKRKAPPLIRRSRVEHFVCHPCARLARRAIVRRTFLTARFPKFYRKMRDRRFYTRCCAAPPISPQRTLASSFRRRRFALDRARARWFHFSQSRLESTRAASTPAFVRADHKHARKIRRALALRRRRSPIVRVSIECDERAI